MEEKHVNILEKMAAEAVQELNAIRHPSAGAKAKNLAKSLIGRGSANISDPIFWPAGLLLTGLMETGRTGNTAKTTDADTIDTSPADKCDADPRKPSHIVGPADASHAYNTADNASGLRKYYDSVEGYLADWLQQGAPVRNPDDALTGTVVLDLYEQTGKEAYRSAAEKIYSYLMGCLRDANGSIIYGQQSGNSWIYADGAGMTAMFLARYARILGKSLRNAEGTAPDHADTASEHECHPAAGPGHQRNEAKQCVNVSNEDAADTAGRQLDEADCVECAAKGSADDTAGHQRNETAREDPLADARLQLVNYARYGMDVRSGLPYHAYDAENDLKLGIIGWGRAVGWLLLGLSEYLICNPKDEELAAFTQTILDAVSARVRPDGMLSWQLDCIEGPLDTSATGMIFYAMLRMNQGIPALFDAAAAALVECVTEDGKVYWCSAECIDIAQYSQQFGHYPWGQGAVLAFLALYEARD